MGYLNRTSAKTVTFSTYGLGDVVAKQSFSPPKAFCTGRCLNQISFYDYHCLNVYKVRGIGRAVYIPNPKNDICPHCRTALFWSTKYSTVNT